MVYLFLYCIIWYFNFLILCSCSIITLLATLIYIQFIFQWLVYIKILKELPPFQRHLRFFHKKKNEKSNAWYLFHWLLRPKYPRRMPAWLTKVIWWLYIFSTPVLCWFHHSALAILFLFQENTYYVLYWTTDWSIHAPGVFGYVHSRFMHLELYPY